MWYKIVIFYLKWPHRQGGCFACCGCTFDYTFDSIARCTFDSIALFYNMHEALRGYCPWGWGCEESIGSTVSDAIVRSWSWLTATRSSRLGCFSTLLQVVDNWPNSLGSRFSTRRLLDLEDFTFTLFNHKSMTSVSRTKYRTTLHPWQNQIQLLYTFNKYHMSVS